jgi:hypothetical protein
MCTSSFLLQMFLYNCASNISTRTLIASLCIVRFILFHAVAMRDLLVLKYIASEYLLSMVNTAPEYTYIAVVFLCAMLILLLQFCVL